MKNKLRIAIDGGDYFFDQAPKNGIQRWLSCYLKEIYQKNDHKKIFDYYFFGKKQKIMGNINPVKLPKKMFARIFLPLKILLNKDRVFLGFSGYLPPLIKFFGVKSIIFIHDFGFYKYPEKYQNASRLIKQTSYAINKSDKIIVFSQYILEELLQRFPKAKSKTEQIYGGFDHLPKPSKKQTSFRYFLYVGVIKPTKNVERLIEIYARFCENNINGPQLLIVGRVEKRYFEQIKANFYYQKFKDRIIFKGEVTDQELSNYYHQAEALINIAEDEGFCFPVGEGLMSGIPVIVNDLKLYSEYQKYFANLIVCKHEKEIIFAMQKIKVKNPIKNSAIFSWRQFYLNLDLTISKLF